MDKDHIDQCKSDILEYLKSKKLKATANVIKQVLENDSIAKKLNNILEGKPNPEDIISPQDATALIKYLNYSKADYQDLKRYTDGIGKWFLPPYKRTTEETVKCLPAEEEMTFSDDCATATVKGQSDAYVARLLQDPDILEIMDRMKQEHGDDVDFFLGEKIGDDGSTQDTYKV